MHEIPAGFALPHRIVAAAHAIGDLGIGDARSIGAQPVGPKRRDRQVVAGHRCVDVFDLPASRAQAGAHFRLLACLEGRIKAIDAGKRGLSHEHVPAEVQRAPHGIDPVKVKDAGKDRLPRIGFAPVTPGGTQRGILERLQRARDEFRVKLGVSVKKQDEFAVRMRPAKVTCLGSAGRRVVQHERACPHRFGTLDARIGRARIDINDLIGPAIPVGEPHGFQAAHQPLPLVAPDHDDRNACGGGILRRVISTHSNVLARDFKRSRSSVNNGGISSEKSLHKRRMASRQS